MGPWLESNLFLQHKKRNNKDLVDIVRKNRDSLDALILRLASGWNGKYRKLRDRGVKAANTVPDIERELFVLCTHHIGRIDDLTKWFEITDDLPKPLISIWKCVLSTRNWLRRQRSEFLSREEGRITRGRGYSFDVSPKTTERKMSSVEEEEVVVVADKGEEEQSKTTGSGDLKDKGMVTPKKSSSIDKEEEFQMDEICRDAIPSTYEKLCAQILQRTRLLLEIGPASVSCVDSEANSILKSCRLYFLFSLLLLSLYIYPIHLHTHTHTQQICDPRKPCSTKCNGKTDLQT
jgi:hypothetical protein